jgi:beta-galactosidase
LEIVASTNRPATGTGQLRAPDGTVVHEFSFSSEAGTILRIAQPHLWTAETPALYTLELALASGQRISETIGLRQVTVVDGVLRLNGRPIKLRGVDHHDLWPEQGRVATEERMRRDLALMRAANINFIRTSHYPPHPRLLELCDELGFYVMDEVPFGFGDAHLTDPAYQEDLFVRARATLQRDRNRASVIIWSVGNENPNTPLTFATGKLVKQLDPSRPICFPQVGSYFGRSHGDLPPWVDIYAPHYPVVATVENYAQTLTRPVIFTEYAHALGLATDRIEAQWAVMQASPRLAGGAVWMFQDQGILRPSAKPVDHSAPTISVWPDATH